MKTKTILACALAAVAAINTNAQSLSSSYFLDGSYKRYQLNPALAPESGFVALPAISSTGISLNSTVGIDNFLFNSVSNPGKLTTFMSSDISADQFLDALPDVADINARLDLDLLSVGFLGFGGFNTVNLSLRSINSLSAPKEFFRFMKSVGGVGTYDITDFDLNSMTYAEIGLGHQHMIGDNLSVGFRIKYMLGLAYADVKEDFSAYVDGDGWMIINDAIAKYAVTGLEFGTDDDGNIDFSNNDFDFAGFVGGGIGVDLGVEYDFSDLVPGLSASAALTDLGTVNWNKAVIAESDAIPYYGGFSNLDDTEATLDELEDQLESMTKFKKLNTTTAKSDLEATLRASVDYDLSFANWINVGELFTKRLDDGGYWESRTAVTLAPGNWFEASANVAFSSWGTSMGWIINFHPNGINFFVGSDALCATVNDKYIPTSKFNANVMVGLTFTANKRKAAERNASTEYRQQLKEGKNIY